jgi:hypothetical protein
VSVFFFATIISVPPGIIPTPVAKVIPPGRSIRVFAAAGTRRETNHPQILNQYFLTEEFTQQVPTRLAFYWFKHNLWINKWCWNESIHVSNSFDNIKL